MNTTKFMQTDSRWSELGYPKNPCYVGRDGCGMVSIANCIIEMEQYKDYTPKTIHPYCKQYAAPSCDGTYWSGIPAMMKHYGMTEVKEHATMDKLWKELEKGGRVAIYLMGSRPGGSKGVHWSSGAHFVCSVGYKYEGGKHKVYVKDSYSNSKLRNEWISYEDNMRNNVKAVWSGKLNGAPAPTPTPPTPTPEPTNVEYYKGAYPNPKKYLEYGDKGTEVTKLQKYIDWMFDGAFFEECGDADGNYGRNTLKWAKKMQRKLGFSDKESNGEVGKKTIAKMKAYGKPIKPTPTPPTPPTPSKDYKVIDISFNQKNVDFNKVKADGIGGVIIRCGFRGYETAKLQEDSQYQNHIKGASKAGLPVGVYFFTQAINEKEGREEADYAISLVEKMGIPLSYPIGVDTEHVEKEKESDPEPRANKISKANRTAAIKGFCERCLERGYRTMIYASTEWFKSKLDMSKLPYDIWCAQWASKCEYKGDIVMWQYSSKGSVKGISGRVDMNHCYIQPTPNPSKDAQKKTVDELAWEVLLDKWGSGDARKKNLEDAGYDYYAVQAKVTELVPIVDKIAHEVIDDPEKWGKGDVRKERLEKAGCNYYVIQKRVNEILSGSIVQRCLDACVVQADWMKDYTYKWENNPTIPKSKKYGTCVTYVACVLQRIGVLKSGQYIWIDNKGKVEGANDKMTVTYLDGTLESNRSKLKQGDIVIGGNGKTGAGEGSHIFVLTGAWSGNDPYIYDQESANRVKAGKAPHHTWKGSFKTIALIRLKADSPQPEKKAFPGTLPTTKLYKTPEEVRADALEFGTWIVNDKRFGYGRMGGSQYKDTKEYKITHSGGCHFCGSNASKIAKAKKAGLKNPEEWEYTYVCNTFVHACYAHAGVPSMLKATGHAWWTSSYEKSKYWERVKKPSKIADLKAGDVLFTETHAMLYMGNGKIAEATSGGGNPSSSKSAWEKSIHICKYTAKRYASVTHVFRLVGTVNTTAVIRYGEVSKRVSQWQEFLDWYFDGKVGKPYEGCFGDNTRAWTIKFQEIEVGKGTGDGLVGDVTLDAAAKVRK